MAQEIDRRECGTALHCQVVARYAEMTAREPEQRPTATDVATRLDALEWRNALGKRLRRGGKQGITGGCGQGDTNVTCMVEEVVWHRRTARPAPG